VLWFAIVFMVLLKIPIAYLCYVVWWAVKDPPQPGEEGAAGFEPGSDGPDLGPSWWRRTLPGRRPRLGPHGSPVRRPEPAPVARSRTKKNV
jgi:hypothetical protein